MSSSNEVKLYHPLYVAVPLTVVMVSSDMLQNVSNFAVTYVLGLILFNIFFSIFKRNKEDDSSE